jgi:hypothetical protein
MNHHKGFFPAVRRYRSLPQWITSSDRAAYHPAGNTIYLRHDQGFRTLMHEYGHWFACKVGWGWLHTWLDSVPT